MIHHKYFPFDNKELESHFTGNIEGRIEIYKKRAKVNLDSSEDGIDADGQSIKDLKKIRQIEKDEIFWTLTTLKSIYDSDEPVKKFSKLLSTGYGPRPPLTGFSTWEECLAGKLHLFFEVDLPSPKAYTQWLYQHKEQRHLVKYVLESMENSLKHGSLEGPTQVDAMLISIMDKGTPQERSFTVIFEAKVLSDISSQVTFDMYRNQMIRNIDVMLEDNNHPHEVVNKRNKDTTLFCLLTPEGFRENPYSRYYGCLYHAYKREPRLLQSELPHRLIPNSQSLAARIGWITFEDCKHVHDNACPWLIC